jgi:CHAT domain-containing protein/tetratricopeptide (TPR) repeat protein
MDLRSGDVQQRSARAKVLVVGAITTTAVIVIGALAAVFHSQRDPSFDDLIEAASAVNERITEGRLGVFEDRPQRKVTRSGGRSQLEPAALRLRSIAATIVEKRAGAHHELAIAHLLAGDAPAGLKLLEPAPDVTVVSHDELIAASALLLEIGKAGDDPFAYARALAASDRALEQNPRSVAATYNRFAALDRLGLANAAATAGKRYLTIDGGSEWSIEVRSRLRELENPPASVRWKVAKQQLVEAAKTRDSAVVESIVREFPEQSRTSGEAEFAALWAEAVVAGQLEEARKWLGVSREIGLTLKRVNGEQLLGDAVAVVNRSDAPRSVADAYLAYRAGRLAYAARRDTAGAARMFGEARIAFERADTPMALVAGYYEAQTLFELHRDAESRKLIDAVLHQARPGHLALRAQALWHRQRMAARIGQQHEALKDALEAHALFERLGERGMTSHMALIAATSLSLLGRIDESWRLRHAAFRAAAEAGEPAGIDAALNATARDLVLQGRYDIAGSFFDVLLEGGLNGRLRADAVLWRELCDARTRRQTPDFKTAEATVNEIADPVQRSDADDDLRLASALTERDREPLVAAKNLTAIVLSKQSKGELNLLPAIRMERSRAYRAAGRAREALADLEQAVREIEERGGAITETALRDAFFGRGGSVYEELADLLAANGDLEKAFIATERARQAGLKESEPVAISDVRPPPGSLVVHLTALPERLLIYTFDGGIPFKATVPVKKHTIVAKRNELLRAITRGDRTAQISAGRSLFDLLFGAIERGADDTRPLLVVPDKVLAEIPFAALTSPSGRFLVEQRAVTVAPYAAAIGNGASATINVQAASAAIISDPAFDPRLFPGLERLRSAGAESVTFSRTLPRSISISGPSATRRALTESLTSHDVVHVAAHAVTNPRDALLSSIALAPDGTDSGTLYLRDVLSLPVRSRLVVLAGCGTGARGGTSGELGSFASAFLAAGAKSVVATLWDVEDSVASRFSEQFYSRLAAGEPPADALRGAQLAMLHSMDETSSNPAAWAAWTYHHGQ